MVKAIPTTMKMACLRKRNSFKKCCVQAIGGIGPVIGCRLRKQNINTAQKLYTRTKCMTRCEFIKWMRCSTKANQRQAGMAYKSLHGKKSHVAKKRNTHCSKRGQKRVTVKRVVLRPSDVSRVTGKIAHYQTRCNRRKVDVQNIAGIGTVLACRLRELGICSAKQLESKTKCFSVCEFKAWMCKKIGANPYQASLAFTCLHESAPTKLLKEKLCLMNSK